MVIWRSDPVFDGLMHLDLTQDRCWTDDRITAAIANATDSAILGLRPSGISIRILTMLRRDP
jgi:hypothetical protein